MLSSGSEIKSDNSDAFITSSFHREMRECQIVFWSFPMAECGLLS